MRFHARGFTLIELMVVIAVLAILLAIAIPNFSNFIRNSRASTGTNDLILALNLARAEAVKRGKAVTICPASGDECGDDWTEGWIVFDDTADGSADPAVGTLIRSFPALNALQLSATDDVTWIRFNRLGGVDAGARRFTLKPVVCTGQHQRRIDIAPIGRISVTRENCS